MADVTLVRIGVAARQLGMSVATLRYYDDRGLVGASERISGTRWYDEEAMRRLAFLHIARLMHIPLEVAAQVLDGERSGWSGSVRAEIGRLDDVIEVARGAQELLSNALACEHEHPAKECPEMRAVLDQMVAGAPPGRLAAIAEANERRSLAEAGDPPAGVR